MRVCIRSESDVKADVAAVAPAVGIPVTPIRESADAKQQEDRGGNE